MRSPARLMTVEVEPSSIGRAHVRIHLGGGHELLVEASHDTDRYRDVTVRWQVPAKVTGRPDEVRDRKTVTLAKERLDLSERTLTSR